MDYKHFLKKIGKIPQKVRSECLKRRFEVTGRYCVLHKPLYLVGGKNISIGNNFTAASGVRLEAWDAFGDKRYMPSIQIGDNVYINYNTHIGAINQVKIGNGVLIGSNVLVTDHNHGGTGDLREATCRPGVWPLSSKGPVIIEDHVWIGENACIMSGVTVGIGAIVGCNAVVTKDVPPYAIVGGVPAKVIKYRFDPELIEELLKIDYSKLDEDMVRLHVDDLYQKLETKGQLSWLPKRQNP